MSKKELQELIAQQRKTKSVDVWEGNCLEYLELVKEDPEIAQLAPSRIYNMVMKYGTTDVPEDLKTAGYEDLVSYDFFKDKIYGTLEPVQDLMRFFHASAKRTETGRRILLLVGPVASGKSTIAHLLKRGLERDDTEAYAVAGCPMKEDPLHLIPLEDRPFWEDYLSVTIQGEPCPVCQYELENTHVDEDGRIKWEEVPVKKIKFSEQKRSGIGTFQPSDPKSQDVSELIGRVNMSKMTLFGETDPRAYQFDGELQIANRGLIEYIELLKCDIKFHYLLITVAQERLIKAPGFPQIFVDTLILAHTNQTEFDTFKADKKNEALHDRIYVVEVPWNLRVKNEIDIYKKMINESEFKDIHLAPHTLELAARFAILSRLKSSTRVSSFIEKMKLYNGEETDSVKKEDVDVKELMKEGREKGEGMDGISPRFIINAINVCLAKKEEKDCINPIDLIRTIKAHFGHHIGIAEEDESRLLTLLMGDKDSVRTEYIETAKKEVNLAFITAYDEQASALFDNYIRNAKSFCKSEKVFDPITDEYEDPDEKLMRSIEELIEVPEAAKKEFRRGIFVYMTDALEKKEDFTYLSYKPLRKAIEQKLMGALKEIVNITITDKTAVDRKTKAKRKSIISNLRKKGYCPHCAEATVNFIGEILRKEE